MPVKAASWGRLEHNLGAGGCWAFNPATVMTTEELFYSKASSFLACKMGTMVETLHEVTVRIRGVRTTPGT